MKTVSKSLRVRNLAFLIATLRSDFFSYEDRHHLLQAYWIASGGEPINLDSFVCSVEKQTRRLRDKHRIRELREHPVITEQQSLIPITGRGMWITPAFRDAWPEQMAAMNGWQMEGFCERETRSNYSPSKLNNTASQCGTRQIVVQRFSDSRPWRWLWRRKMLSAGMVQAAVLFRLERFGIPAPRLLAVGERPIRPWQMESFVATEIPTQTMPFKEWLRNCREERRSFVLEKTEKLTMALLEAGFVFDGCPFHVTADGHVMISDVSALRRKRLRNAKRLNSKREQEQMQGNRRELEGINIGGAHA